MARWFVISKVWSKSIFETSRKKRRRRLWCDSLGRAYRSNYSVHREPQRSGLAALQIRPPRPQNYPPWVGREIFGASSYWSISTVLLLLKEFIYWSGHFLSPSLIWSAVFSLPCAVLRYAPSHGRYDHQRRGISVITLASISDASTR